MALADRLRDAAARVGKVVGETIREGTAAYENARYVLSPGPTEPLKPRNTSGDRMEAHLAAVAGMPLDALNKGSALTDAPGKKVAERKAAAEAPRGAEFNPLDAYGRVTNEAAMTGIHPGTWDMSFNTIERLSRLSVPALVINHQVDDIAEFCVPQASPYSYGFRITLDDDEKEPTTKQKKRMEEIQRLIMQGGGKYQSGGLEGFVRRILRDSLTFDACGAEILKDRSGQPIGLFAYDAKTIRKRAPDNDWLTTGRWGEDPGYVQWVEQRVWAEWAGDEFIYGVRRPRTGLETFGYGFPELEELVTVMTGFARSENYNTVNFTSGIHASTILGIVSTMDTEAFTAYRRMFEANFSAAAQKRRLPMIQLDPELKEDLKAVNLGHSNRDMEYSNWMNYQIKLICAAWGVDPASAVGMVFGNEGQSSSLGSASPGERYMQSKSHGIRTKLRWLGQFLTPFVKLLDPEMKFVFAGFESVSEQDKLDMDMKQLGGFVTVNEIRTRYDLPPIEGGAGDVVANPYVSQVQQMEASMAQGQDDGYGGDGGYGGMGDDMLMASMNSDLYLPNGGTVDSITKAVAARHAEGLRRGAIRTPAGWRPGNRLGLVERGAARETVLIEVKV